MKTINQFIKEMREIFGDIEYRAEKDGQVFASKGYIDVDGNWVTPAQIRVGYYDMQGNWHPPIEPQKLEKKNGNKSRRR